MKLKLSMICTQQKNGSYLAVCPDVKSCYTQGDTYEKAVSQLKELVEATITEDLTDDEILELTYAEQKIFSEFEIAV